MPLRDEPPSAGAFTRRGSRRNGSTMHVAPPGAYLTSKPGSGSAQPPYPPTNPRPSRSDRQLPRSSASWRVPPLLAHPAPTHETGYAPIKFWMWSTHASSTNRCPIATVTGLAIRSLTAVTGRANKYTRDTEDIKRPGIQVKSGETARPSTLGQVDSRHPPRPTSHLFYLLSWESAEPVCYLLSGPIGP